MKLSNELVSVFNKLYSGVNEKFTEEKLKKRRFTDNRWTAKDQFLFTDWLLDKLKNNKVLHIELCELLKCSKNLSTNTLVGEFNLQYSWEIYFDITEIEELTKRGFYATR